MNEQLNTGWKRRLKVNIRVTRCTVDNNIIEARGEECLVTANLLGSVYLWDRRKYIGHFGRRVKCESWEMLVCMQVTLGGGVNAALKKIKGGRIMRLQTNLGYALSQHLM